MGTIEVRRCVAAAVERIGSVKAAAREWGVHPSFVGAVIRGEKRPGRAICERLGLPMPASNRGGKPDRGKVGRSPRRRGRRIESAEVVTVSTSAETPPTGIPAHPDRAAHLAAAAAIKLERNPRPAKPPGERSWRQTVKQMVREHFRREKAIREYAPVLRRRVAEIEAVGTAA